MINENKADRSVRTAAGVVLLMVAFLLLEAGAGAPWGVVVAILGAVFLLTGVIGFCPAYKLCGISTCKAPQA